MRCDRHGLPGRLVRPPRAPSMRRPSPGSPASAGNCGPCRPSWSRLAHFLPDGRVALARAAAAGRVARGPCPLAGVYGRVASLLEALRRTRPRLGRHRTRLAGRDDRHPPPWGVDPADFGVDPPPRPARIPPSSGRARLNPAPGSLRSRPPRGASVASGGRALLTHAMPRLAQPRRRLFFFFFYAAAFYPDFVPELERRAPVESPSTRANIFVSSQRRE